MRQSRITLTEAVKFHGHLGPYLVLGLLMGESAVKELGCRRHFGIKAVVKGADKRPKSCLIDGIQISTGCTYGKGNIQKIKGSKIQASFRNLQNNREIKMFLKGDLIKKLDGLNGHKDSEAFARELLSMEFKNLFEFK